LVVEDDGGLRAAWAQALSERGWRVRVAATLEAARAELANKPPDLCVIDVRVGDDNGLALA
jgi:two-component system response regulator RegA